MNKQIHIYDTTLRDGTQGEGFQLSVAEKVQVAELLDDLGVAYIEGGWPGSNPRDAAFFDAARGLKLKNARIAAFGSTRRAKVSCEEDPSIQALLAADVPVLTIFGKSWRFHTEDVLRISAEKNLEIIEDTVRYLKARCDELIFDAEHFFDGAADDEAFAMAALDAAVRGGADFLVLCDTNGGSLPHVLGEQVARVVERFDTAVGIHTHNDSELAVANSLEAIRRGATMVQGTINGYGERCGNANLVSIIASAELKMDKRCLPEGGVRKLTHMSRMVDELANNIPIARQAFVGRSAFAHKGGVHVNAVLKSAATYEHIEPEAVGNERRILVSDLSGRSNIIAKAKQFGVELNTNDPTTMAVLERIKRLEHEGYQFEGAEASLELLMEEARGRRPNWFSVKLASVTTREVGRDGLQPSEAQVKVQIGDQIVDAIEVGNGPVNALAKALVTILVRTWPELEDVRLVDYRVRILDSARGTAARVRVLIQATDGHETWGTVGVSTNVVEASWQALVDTFEHRLMKAGVVADSAHTATRELETQGGTR